MAVTRNDVARVAGVSAATVAYVINNGPKPVAPETCDRVPRAIETLGYQPSAVARNLRLQRTSTLGLIVPDTHNPYFAEVARGVEDYAFEHGYRVVLCHSSYDSQRELEYRDVLRAERAAGVIWIPATANVAPTRKLADYRMPVIVLDRSAAGEHITSVMADNYGGGYAATKHLIDLGHRRSGCIARPEALSHSHERIRGYASALRDHGLLTDQALIARGGFRLAIGREAANQLLTLDPPPTAIFVYYDIMAIGALRAAYERGLRVPQDLSIVGFDDIPQTAFTCPALTTVAQPKFEMGRRGGVLICGTGLGMSIAANKLPGVRAALCHDVYTAHQSRAHNDANILCMGAWVVTPQRAAGIVEEWLKTPFEGGRHVPRLAKLDIAFPNGHATDSSAKLFMTHLGLAISPLPTAFAPVLFAGRLAEGVRTAREAGFTAVELSLRAPEDISEEVLAGMLKEHHLSLAAIATGPACLQDGLCLSSPDAAAHGRFLVRDGGADLGQGSNDAMLIIAAQTLGVPLGMMRTHTGDTTLDPHGGMSTASRVTFVSGNAVLKAAQMLKQGEGGAILNVAASRTVRRMANPIYAYTKAGMIEMTLNMAKDYLDHGIRVNCLCPGLFVYTPVKEPHVKPIPTPLIRRQPKTARQGDPADLAYAAVYLASDEASFVAGQVIGVDGGDDVKLTDLVLD